MTAAEILASPEIIAQAARYLLSPRRKRKTKLVTIRGRAAMQHGEPLPGFSVQVFAVGNFQPLRLYGYGDN